MAAKIRQERNIRQREISFVVIGYLYYIRQPFGVLQNTKSVVYSRGNNQSMEEASLQDSPFATHSYQKSSPKGSARKLFALIALVLVVALGIFGASKFMGSTQEEEVKGTITPTPTEIIFPSDTPTPEFSPTPAPSNTPTPKPTSSPVDKTTRLDRSDLSVAVQNGSGEAGVASKGSDVLKSFGYNVISTGNASNYNYEDVTIKVKSEKKAYLPLLQKDLEGSYTVNSATSDLSASSSADALVIIGK